MLLNKAFNQGDVVSFKLTSGEELIARYQGETITEYQISKPVSLTPTPNGTLGMIPSMFSIDITTANINLQKSAVAMTSATRKEISDEYTKGTSGIKPATSLDWFIEC